MLTFLTFKWNPPVGYRSSFSGHNVDVLRRMVRRHYKRPHRFVCVTDDPTGITEYDVEVFELWDDFQDVPNPSGRKNPSCYRRLRVFARNAGEWLGERFVHLDLDCVITREITGLLNRPEEFVCWGDTNPRNPYNGSMWLVKAGARPQVWEQFNPATSPTEARRAGYFGSDQAWFAHILGPCEARFTRAHGVYSFRNEMRRKDLLPSDARIVFFHGKHDPWDEDMMRIAWIKDHYR